VGAQNIANIMLVMSNTSTDGCVVPSYQGVVSESRGGVWATARGIQVYLNIASIMVITLAVDGRCALLAVPRVMRSPFQVHHRLCFPSYPHATN
jgi:hypothetical protein